MLAFKDFTCATSSIAGVQLLRSSMRIRRSASRSRTVTFASLWDAGVTYQLQYFLLVPAHDGLVELRGDKDSE
jgi:hypothetical protein